MFIMYFITAILVSTLISVNCLTCDMQQCSGPYSIKIPSPPPLATLWGEYLTVISRVQNEVEGFLIARSMYSAYCYTGDDINGGCSKTVTPKPLSGVDEAEEWIRNGKCKVAASKIGGRGKYWGSDSDNCCNALPEEWLDHKDWEFLQQEFHVFARHSCVCDWYCYLHKSQYPVVWTPEGKFIYGKKGNLIKIEPGTFHRIDAETNLYIPLSVEVKVISATINVKCFSLSNQETLCQIPENSVGASGEIIEVDGQTSYFQNYFLEVSDPIHRPSRKPTAGGKKIEHKGADWTGTNQDIEHTLSTATSLEDLKPVIHALYYLNAKSDYNMVKVVKDIIANQDILSQIIKSVSKVDDELLGNLVGSDSKAKWFNPDLFYQCPCEQRVFEKLSNCGKGIVYKEGRWQQRSGKETCNTFGGSEIKGFEIFGNASIVIGNIEVGKARGTSYDLEGWSFYSEKKEEVWDSMVFHNESTNTNGLSFWKGLDPTNILKWDIFTKLSSFVSYIALLISILSCCKR